MSQFVHTLANAGPFKEKKETYFTKNGKLCKESVAKKYSTDCNWLLAIYIYSSNSKESTETYLLELTPYKGMCLVVCLHNGH